MSASRNESLSTRDGLAVSTAAMSEVPWKTAAGAGVIVAGADLVLHLTTFHWGLSAIGNSASAGIVALFAVAGAGLMLRRERASRAVRWAHAHPWQFALVPGAATAVIVFVLSVIFGSGLVGDVFTAVWHGALAFGVTGVVGSLAGRDKDSR
jgi:hypothetical protein